MPIPPRRKAPLPTGWGIVSTGHIARAFAADLARSDRPDIVAVQSRSMERAAQFARDHSGAARTGKLRSVRPYDDLTDMLGDAAVEMIYVGSINIAHADTVRAALDANKPVLCEKPMTMSAAEALDLAREARRRRVFLMEGLWTRHLPAVKAAKALVDAGAIGAVRRVEGTLHANRDYDPRSRLFDPEQGGGALHDLGVYPLSLAVQHAGAPDVDDVAGRWWAAPSGTDMRAEVRYRANDIDVTIACGFTGAGANRFIIHGEIGTLVLDDTLHIQRITHYKRGIAPPDLGAAPWLIGLREWWDTATGKAKRRSYRYKGNGLRFQAESMATSIRDGLHESADAPLDDTIAVLSIIDRVLEQPPEVSA